MKVVIIGGVAGGATAAARLRRLDESAEIIILERTGYVSYANCGLPYYVGGVITDREELTLQTPEGFRNRFGIDVRVGQEAVELHPEQHTVTVRRLEDGSTYALHYDKLILSPGARPVRPNLPGEDDPRVFTLRTVEDTLRIRAYLDEHPVRRAVVVGGGFIGLEMAENLVHAGVHTTLLQRGAQVLPPLDADMAAEIHAYLRGQGVELRLGVRVSGFSPQGDGLAVELEGGERFPADLVLLGIGGPGPGRQGGDLGGRADAHQRPGRLRRGRRGGGAAFCHRSQKPHCAGRPGQQAGAHCRRPHLRAAERLHWGAGHLGAQAL